MLLNLPCVSLVLSILSAFERAGRRGAARLAGGFRVGLRRKFKSPTPLLGADRGVERVFFTVMVLWGGRRFCLPYRAGSPCRTGIVTPLSGTSCANRLSVSAVPGEFAPSGLPLINSPSPSPRVGAGQPSRGLGRAPAAALRRPPRHRWLPGGAGLRSLGRGKTRFTPAPKGAFRVSRSSRPERGSSRRNSDEPPRLHFLSLRHGRPRPR